MKLWSAPAFEKVGDTTTFATRRINASDLADVVRAFPHESVVVRRGENPLAGQELTDFENLATSDLERIVILGDKGEDVQTTLTIGSKVPAQLLSVLTGSSVSQQDHKRLGEIEDDIVRTLISRGHREPDRRQVFSIASIAIVVIGCLLLLWSIFLGLDAHRTGVPLRLVVQYLVFLTVLLIGVVCALVAGNRINKVLAEVFTTGYVRISTRTRSNARDPLDESLLAVGGAAIGALLALVIKRLAG